MRNEGCPVRGKTRKDCWRKCPVKELFSHGQGAEADRTAKRIGCPPEGLNIARGFGKT